MMKTAARVIAIVFLVACGILLPSSAVGAAPSFGDEKTSWHGFDRYDFLMDEADLSIRSHKAAPDEGNAVRRQISGQLRCVVVAPKEPAAGNPWSWQGYYFDHEPQTEIELSTKSSFVGMSRGGRNAYTWATANPDKVSCIYADNPRRQS